MIPLSNDQLLVDALAKLMNDMQTVTVATRSDTLRVEITFRITALTECSCSDFLFLSFNGQYQNNFNMRES